MFQLFLNGFDGKSIPCRLREDASIADLKQIIHDKTLIKSEDMRILYCSKELKETDENGKQIYLSDYRLRNEGNIYLVLRLNGRTDAIAAAAMDALQSKEPVIPDFNDDIRLSDAEAAQSSGIVATGHSPNPVLKVLGPEIELTSEPDMITFDDDMENQRSRMPCGHAIGPESLTTYCRSLLTNGKHEFGCPYINPHCGQVWDFNTVQHHGLLTEKELEEFEIKISVNYITTDKQIKTCPRCQSHCERKKPEDIRVICPVCSRNMTQLYEFCWLCLFAWQTQSLDECGNVHCSGENPRKQILRDCPKKMINSISNCPSLRVCPKCGFMIEHTDGCNQMSCRCGQKFCFICLKMTNSNGSYQCNGRCTVTAIQTE